MATASGTLLLMLRMRTATLAAVLLTLVVAGCLVSTPSQAAVRTRATLRFSTTAPIAGESFVASGRVSTRFSRPVTLRVLSAGRWKVVKRVATGRTGVFRIRGLATTAARHYSLLVPAIRRSGRVYAKVATPRRLVRPVSQSGSVEVLPQVAQPGRVPAAADLARGTVVARFSPARPGRVVTFRRQLADDSWAVVGSARQRVDGTAYLFGPARRGAFRATAGARAGAPAVSTASATGPWALEFSDEFSGSALDTTKWSYREGKAPSRTRATNDRRAVSFGSGTLRMQVKRDPAAPRSRYLNGQISTDGKFAYTYGTFSARMRFAPGRGQHGSFWLQSPTYGSFPGRPGLAGAEVDVAEFFGKGYPRGGFANFLYYLDKRGENVKVGGVWPRAGGLLRSRDTFWNSFHVYTVKWTPKGYTFYIDGRVVYSTSQALSHTDQFLILSLLTSDWELPEFRFRGAGTMAVDWVRVWRTPVAG